MDYQLFRYLLLHTYSFCYMWKSIILVGGGLIPGDTALRFLLALFSGITLGNTWGRKWDVRDWTLVNYMQGKCTAHCSSRQYHSLLNCFLIPASLGTPSRQPLLAIWDVPFLSHTNLSSLGSTAILYFWLIQWYHQHSWVSFFNMPGNISNLPILWKVSVVLWSVILFGWILWGPHTAVFRASFYLCIQELLLAVFRWLYMVPGIEAGSAMLRQNALWLV